jgi:hypothetical protein
VRKALADRPVLVASEVRDRLLELLEPARLALLQAQERTHDTADAGSELLLLLQPLPAPGLLRIVRDGADIARARFSQFAEGAALADACQAFCAAALAMLPPGGGEKAVGVAEGFGDQGGFVVCVDPADGDARLLLCPPGTAVADALVVGGFDTVEPVGN